MVRTHDDLDRICASCNYGVRRVNGEIIKGPYGWKAKWVVNCPPLGIVNAKECGRCRNRIKDMAYLNDVKSEFWDEQIDRWHNVRELYAKKQGVPPYKAILPNFVIESLNAEDELKLKRKIEDVELHIKDEDYLGHYQYWEEKL